MDCRTFRRRLDEGLDPRDESGLAHADACPDCAAAMRAMEEVESVLAQRFATVDASFTDGVLRRISVLPSRAQAVPLPQAEPSLPWWGRVAMDPATLLAAVLACVTLGFGPGLWQGAEEAVPGLIQLLETPPSPVVGEIQGLPPVFWILAAAPVLAAGSYLLFRWGVAMGAGRRL